MSKRGLPSGLQMRHDTHYVEELSRPQPANVGKILPIELIDPNPEQPRVEIGDLSELTASIIEKGVLEPLLVKPLNTGRWMIIAGERRWRASGAAGLSEVPCIEIDVDDRGVAEIALIENLQRKDLTVWEEAEGIASLCSRFGYTHEEVAKKLGKSRSTVTELLSIAALPTEVKDSCRNAHVNTKSLLLQIVRQPDEESMFKITDTIISKGLKRDDARELRKREISGTVKENIPLRPRVFTYSSPQNSFAIKISYNAKDVTGKDIEKALLEAAAHFRK